MVIIAKLSNIAQNLMVTFPQLQEVNIVFL